jgi:hypothetical protein
VLRKATSRLHLQSLAPAPKEGRRQASDRLVVKIIAESLSQHDAKHVVPTPLSRDKGRIKNTKED